MPSNPSASSTKSSSTSSAGAGPSKASRTGPAALKAIADLISSGQAKNIVVLTGAGISTSAGIPDFRSPETGLYANLQALDLPFPEAVFELGYFKSNPKPFWTLAKEIYPGKHYPTPTHYFLHLLHLKSILKRVFTQNIDTLEHLSGLPAEKIIEAHGSFATAHCLACRKETSREYVLASGVRKGEIVRCAEKGCRGLVKPDIVFFGEGLPDRFFETISDLGKCDLVIVIGTSLQVQPFSLLPERAGANVPRLLINREAVGPFEALENKGKAGRGVFSRGVEGRKRDMMWNGDADDGVRRLCVELGWEKELDEMIRKGRKRLEVQWREVDDGELEEKQAEEGKGGVLEDEREDVLAQPAAEETQDVDGDNQVEQRDSGDNEVEELLKAIENDLKVTETRKET